MMTLSKQRSMSPNKKPLRDVTQSEYMNKIVSDATKRVKQLKRQRTEQINNCSFSDGEISRDSPEKIAKNYAQQLEQFDLSSIVGEGLEWSPKASPKQKKKKGFVKLSSYEGATYSSISGYQGCTA